MLPGVDGRAQAARRLQGPPRRAHGRDPAPHRPLAARRRRLRARSASGRSTSTATSSPPTAARAAPRSPAATSRSRSPSARLQDEGKLGRRRSPARVAAVSCGVVDGTPLLDLDYAEDSTAEVDANVVMTGEGGLVEVQATAERTPLSRAHLDELLALAERGIDRPARRAGGGHRVAAAMRLVLATRNEHKLREFQRLLPGVALEPLPADVVLPPEDGDTFVANALGKARAAAARARPRRDRRRLGRRGGRARRRARASSPRASPGRDATDAENLARLRAEAPAGSPLRYVCVIAHVDARTARSVLHGHAARARWRRRARRRRLRLRPRVPARRRAPTAARWPSSPTRRRTRSPTAAARRARCSRGW